MTDSSSSPPELPPQWPAEPEKVVHVYEHRHSWGCGTMIAWFIALIVVLRILSEIGQGNI